EGQRRLEEERRRRDALLGRDVLRTAMEGWADTMSNDVGSIARLAPDAARKLFANLVSAQQVAEQNAPQLVEGLRSMVAQTSQHPQLQKDMRKAGEQLFTQLVHPADLKKLLVDKTVKTITQADFWTPTTDAIRNASRGFSQIGLFPDQFDTTGIAGARTWQQM